MKRKVIRKILCIIVSMAIVITTMPMRAFSINNVEGTKISNISVKVGNKFSQVYKLNYDKLENYFIEVYYVEANRESITIINDNNKDEYEKTDYLQKPSEKPTALTHSIDDDDIPNYEDILKNYTTVDLNGEYGSVSVSDGVLLIHWVDSETEIAEAESYGIIGEEYEQFEAKVNDLNSKIYWLETENEFLVENGVQLYYTAINSDKVLLRIGHKKIEIKKNDSVQKAVDKPRTLISLAPDVEIDEIPSYEEIIKPHMTIKQEDEYSSFSTGNGELFLIHWVEEDEAFEEAENVELAYVKEKIVWASGNIIDGNSELDVWRFSGAAYKFNFDAGIYEIYYACPKTDEVTVLDAKDENDMGLENSEGHTIFKIRKDEEAYIKQFDEKLESFENNKDSIFEMINPIVKEIKSSEKCSVMTTYRFGNCNGILILDWGRNFTGEDEPAGSDVELKIQRTELETGAWVLERDLYDKKKAYIALPFGIDNTMLKISVDESVGTVNLNGNDVSKNHEGTYDLELSSTVGDKGFTNIVTLRDNDGNANIYEIVCRSAKWDSMPDKVVDYICPDSQYTNGKGLSTYGIRGVGTLLGSTETVSIYDCLGPASLGNFGGYITYYYKNAIKDNPCNPYGIDFITFGNSVDASTEFAEPGQVWVSEDGNRWYAIAGAAHYDDDTDWNASITYKKTDATEIYPFVDKSYYPLHVFDEENDDEITFKGINIGTMKGINEHGNIRPKFPAFGYTDVGERAKYLPSNEVDINGINIADNPYLGFYTKEGWQGRLFLGATDGIDLAWAVDESGQPVKFEQGIHYIKIQTASNIKNDAINEKSTEVNMVMVAEPDESKVGKTSNPKSIYIDGKKINLKNDVYVYEDVEVDGPFLVSVNADENNNVFINDKRGHNIIFEEKPAKNIVRVIVQEGKKEPLIYIFNLKEKTEDKEASAVLVMDANGGKVNDADQITCKFDEHMLNIKLPVPTNPDKSLEFMGWYTYGQDGQKKYEKYPSKVTDITLYAKWNKKNNYIPTPEKNINVTFRLIGATKSEKGIDLSNEEAGYCGSEYVNWVKTKSYTLPEGSTVADLFIKATADAGIRSKGASSGYVSTIYAPDLYGGYELSEFTNGLYSGWMYTMNGKHTDGINVQKLVDGAEVVWHYIQDYRWEVEDWFDEPNWPSLAKLNGITKYFNLWLNAPDIDPSANIKNETLSGNVITSRKGNKIVTVVKTQVTANKDIATITIKDENIPEMLKQAKENKSSEIVLDAKADEADADKVTVELPKKVAENILADTKADLTIKLPETELKLSRDALKEIVSQAKGDKLIIGIEKVKNSLDDLKKLTGESADIFTLTVKGGDREIHNFGNGIVTVRKAITDKLENKKVAAVYMPEVYIPENNPLVVMNGKRIVIDKKNFYEFTTNHFSYFALVDADEAGIEAKEMMSADEVKNLIKNLKLKVKTKALKKSIRVILKTDKTTLNNLRDNGYIVKYKFYRANKKKGKFKVVATKDVNKYTNSKITKGKTYYYKARLMVYDGDGNLVIKTSFKQCNTAKAKVKAVKKSV